MLLADTIRTIYATVGSVFPSVDTWTTDTGDLLLVATDNPIVYDADFLRRGLQISPFKWPLRSGLIEHMDRISEQADLRFLQRHERLPWRARHGSVGAAAEVVSHRLVYRGPA